MVISNTIKNAIRDWLQVKMNECYKTVTNDTIDMFKFETNWVYEGNLFKQYDPTTGRIIKDQFDNPIKYIPCAVQSITGERREIPNTYIADVSIPIAMLIFDLDSLSSVEATLTYFNDQTIGEVFNIQALYNNVETTYQFSFSMDLPDFDDFMVMQGENAKAVVFQLNGVITQNVEYGNELEYELSIDSGTTFERLLKSENTNTRIFNFGSDQRLGGYEQRAIEDDSVWTLNLSIIVQKANNNVRSISSQLIPFIYERDYTKIKKNGVQVYQQDPLNRLKLKIITSGIDDIIKDVILANISCSANYGDYVILTLTFRDKDTSIPDVI